MYSVILLSHGKLAEEFLQTSEMIIGKQENIRALGLEADESKDHFENRILVACEELAKKDGILLLTDLYGGTPTNAAIMAVFNKYPRLEIMAGINLAIVVEAILCRDFTSLEESVEKLKGIGQQGIINVKEILATQSLDDE